MANEILIDVNSLYKRVAIIENDELAEIYVENNDIEKTVGNIYIGKVCRVLPGMQAAFVDIGTDKNAFLHVRDAVSESEYINNPKQEFNISDVLKVGQSIIVQVIKEPFGTKGARVTTHLTLAGRNLILLPTGNYIGISRRIEDAEKKEQLKELASKVKPEGMGLIVRTMVQNDDNYNFSDDVKFLTNLWTNIYSKTTKGPVPRCIYKDMSIILKTVRDYLSPSIDRLVINNRHDYEEILELAEIISPSLKLKIQCADSSVNLFEKNSIEYSIKQALDKKVWLKCGGYLIIEETEALTVIDVNTGKFIGKNNLEDTIVKTNLEAVNEIARQLRLRDIGGIIIVDFIDMNDKSHEELLINAMNEALKKDRTKTIVVGMTGLGLLEMTRKKIRKKLSSVLQSPCPNCNGTGKVPNSAINNK